MRIVLLAAVLLLVAGCHDHPGETCVESHQEIVGCIGIAAGVATPLYDDVCTRWVKTGATGGR